MKIAIFALALIASGSASAWTQYNISRPNAITGNTTFSQYGQNLGYATRPNSITGTTTYYNQHKQRIGTVSRPNAITGQRTVRIFGK